LVLTPFLLFGSAKTEVALFLARAGRIAPVLTENPVGSENAQVTIIRGIMVATMMSSLFISLFAFVASSFRTRGALQAEILALRHQLAVLQ
jgi:hypothetical protein